MTRAVTRLEVTVSNRQRALRVSAAEVTRAAAAAARYAGGPSGRLSVVLVGDRKMRGLNRRFAHCLGTTDVLAFDLSDKGRGAREDISGEVVVNASLARVEAARRGKKSLDELLLYVVHGVLHLGGYRDGGAAERHRMRAAEAAVMKGLRLHRTVRP